MEVPAGDGAAQGRRFGAEEESGLHAGERAVRLEQTLIWGGWWPEDQDHGRMEGNQ